MARVALSEYAAKKILIGENYQGISVDVDTDISGIELEPIKYVVKVDDGVKKRNKNNLVRLNIAHHLVLEHVEEFLDRGYQRVLIEPFFEHNSDEEKYLSATVTRVGIHIIYGLQGGNEVESGEGVSSYTISRSDYFSDHLVNKTPFPDDLLASILDILKNQHASFIEINPLLVDEDGNWLLLDLAIELDSAKQILWSDMIRKNIASGTKLNTHEQSVSKLDNQSNATFSLKVLDKNAEIFTLLSGGGASLVTMDSLVQEGLQENIANYSEYSGAPNKEETEIFTREVIDLLLSSSAEKKVFLVAGGVANFTDVYETLSGVLDACSGRIDELKQQDVLIYFRRGGPRQKEGLEKVRQFFSGVGIDAIISDSSKSFESVATEIKEFLNRSI